jgi:hypothetical protein
VRRRGIGCGKQPCYNLFKKAEAIVHRYLLRFDADGA